MSDKPPYVFKSPVAEGKYKLAMFNWELTHKRCNGASYANEPVEPDPFEFDLDELVKEQTNGG